jgi:hypothetical protein
VVNEGERVDVLIIREEDSPEEQEWTAERNFGKSLGKHCCCIVWIN